ncbi:SGNH/GDSL hydrolase family protein [Jiella mangrovi]|uniref:DUF459 domain-containing protein n=1 Tax=Jiella mangrovi TaxID=2821407 RepID=A0ABS4BFQ8_9HYPH|nr:DUF459 domain-containing protein [Jiella mangrovi]MBP0615594.1 DUF459 domain-containing protein [Jiella mangrovi]
MGRAGETLGGSRRRRGSIATALLVMLAFLAGDLLVHSSPAQAQQRPRTILDMLFGGGERRQPYRVVPRYSKPPARAASPGPARRKTRARKSAPKPVVAAPATPEKSKDAKTVLVVGDFLAASLASGLKDAYGDNEGVSVKSAVSGSSGLVRQDHYDWSKELGPLIDADKPAVVVVMLGANDRQPIDGPSGKVSVRSPEWNAEYERRVDEIAGIVEKSKVPLVWVGAPPFKFDRMSEDMVYLNDLYRQAAQKVSGEYVDVWEGFVDETDGFIYSGPGVDGQTVQLRNSDGISMTDAGDDKLAFFAKKAIDRFVSADGPVALGGQPDGMQLPPLANAATAVRSPPVALDDPSLDGGESLLGGNATRIGMTLEASPRDKLVLTGRGTGHVDGRADDFAWNDKSGAVASDDQPVAYRGSIDLKKVRKEQGIKPPEAMPTILDAIMDDWSNDNQAAKGDK